MKIIYREYLKLESFFNEKENFKNTNILSIDFENDYYFTYLNVNHKLHFNKIIFLNNLFKGNKINKLFDENYDMKFQYIFLIIKNFDRKKLNYKRISKILNKFCHNGSKIFIQLNNKQNFFAYLNLFSLFRSKKSKSLKERNLYISDELLLYDYFFSNYSLINKFDSDKPKIINLKYLYFLYEIIDYQRFYFLAKDLFVKYYYVTLPHKNT